MRRHELYTDNYCTSRVILHEAQYFSTSAKIIGNNECKSHFCFISCLDNFSSEKNAILHTLLLLATAVVYCRCISINIYNGRFFCSRGMT